MNREINQTCQKISCEDILNKKFYPVWFFTNERVGNFFQALENYKEIRKVFSIGGGGDFAFSLLSTQALNQIDEINVCEYTNSCEGLDQKHKQVTCKLWDRKGRDEVGIKLSKDGKRRLTAPAWKATP